MSSEEKRPEKGEGKPEEKADERDALDILESETKEAEKDAEINRILQAFRLDA